VSGARPPVVLLHSGGMSSRQWGRLAAALEDRHAVHAPDFVGHGREPWPGPGADPLAVDVDRVATLLGDLGRPAHVVGHSYGGVVALQVARRAPGTVRSLALFEPVAFGALRDPADAEGLADLARIEDDPVFRAAGDGPGGLDAWFEVFVDFWSGPGAWRAMGPIGQRSFRDAGRGLVRGAHALTADRTGLAAYAEVAAPTLLLTGDRSPVAAQRTAAVLAGALPDARLEVVAGAGHMGPLTHMAEVNGAIADHLVAA
jgi:pimeloyl-ACP methyl ester carboxylesterase